jgi:hypothetical protein
MKIWSKAQIVLIVFVLALSVAHAPAFAQDQSSDTNPDNDALEDVEAVEGVDKAAELKKQMEADKTGTNPMNFTFDARLFNEYRWLNTEGDGSQNLVTGEFRMPIAGGKWQARAKVRRVDLKADFNNDGFDDVDEGGFGDTDIRFATVPYLNMEKKMGVFLGVEFFLDTASEDSLGTGANSVAPFVFLPFFNPIGPGSIFVPGYQHTVSVNAATGRDDVHTGLIDMFLVKTWSKNKYWGYIDPQIILDYEDHTEFMLIELQAGMMVGPAGHSIWAMPSFGVGTHRPYDFSLEVGYKVVW